MGERQPLLEDNQNNDLERATSKDDTDDGFVIDFDPAGDPENPIEWSKNYKRGIVALLAFIAFTITFTCISVVPVANRIVRDLNRDHHTDKSASVLLVTIWELGEAAGPLFVGPLSELYGRQVVINVANVLFICATILAACCQSTHLFIAARCLTGVVVAGNVLNPAIVGDIYLPEQRGSAMSLIMLAPLLGGAVGPAIAGAIAENLGWRQILWMSAALMAACEFVFLCCFRETYKVTILRRRAAKLSNETGNTYRTIFDVEGSKVGSFSSFVESITRPFYVYFGSSVLQAVSLFAGMTFTFFYIMSTTLPDILENIYGLSPALTGSCFITFSAGSVIMVIVCNLYLDKIYIKLREANNGIGQPEYRLPFVIIGSVTLPMAVAAYGWIVDKRLPLSVLLVCVGVMGNTMMLGYLPMSAYIVDMLGLYSASGMTAVIVARCLMGTFFPMAATPLVSKFGYGWGFTVLAGISIALAPIPMLLYRYGARWRQRSPYTSQS
ncbi:hypothetical protein OHC33_002533 [Knufia fluminis]|uniref:Major facilitator superfamily (MFS) profile domain-containing protein n=2 Tax=Knufia TaxID=430999 RepID=A0AAN8EKK6_9EURO|nr:hypothetical protein OHC33_002533 [Knufia fluminis]